jgi:hypothetical protein
MLGVRASGSQCDGTIMEHKKEICPFNEDYTMRITPLRAYNHCISLCRYMYDLIFWQHTNILVV